MRRTTKDELGGTALCVGLVTLLWLLFAIVGCSPTLPNAPNAQPTRTAARHIQPHSHLHPIYAQQLLPRYTIYPAAGQHFPHAPSINAAFYGPSASPHYSDDLYGWRGAAYGTDSLPNGMYVGLAAERYPFVGQGIMLVRACPDSITMWGWGLLGDGNCGELTVAVGGYTVTHRATVRLTAAQIGPVPLDECFMWDTEESTICPVECPSEPEPLRYATDPLDAASDLPAVRMRPR